MLLLKQILNEIEVMPLFMLQTQGRIVNKSYEGKCYQKVVRRRKECLLLVLLVAKILDPYLKKNSLKNFNQTILSA